MNRFSYTYYVTRFKDAIEAGDTAQAIEAAEGMSAWTLTTGQERDLVVLLARARDPHFTEYAHDFIDRYIDERHTSFEVLIAMGAVTGLWEPQVSQRCEEVLNILLRF